MLDSLLLSLWMIAAAGSSGQTPFWAQANTGGLMPSANGGLVCAALETGYQEAGSFQWRAGTTLAARAAVGEGAGAQVNEAYAGLRWRAFALDLGMKRHTAGFVSDRSLGSLSVTGGNVAWSNNARPMPGYTLTLDPVPIPVHAALHRDPGRVFVPDHPGVQYRKPAESQINPDAERWREPCAENH